MGLKPRRHRFSFLYRRIFYLIFFIYSNGVTYFLFSDPDSSNLPSLPLPSECRAFTGPHPLPLGHNRYLDTTLFQPPLALPCLSSRSLLTSFMSYSLNSSCPDDESLSQKLILSGCDPLPMRRCRSASPEDPDPPLPYPHCLWATPPDKNIHWSAYSCKSFKCLVNRVKARKSDDCKDCFDLSTAGRERKRWVTPSSDALDFTIDEVLSFAKPPGSIRIGLDLGGGSGTFAVRMHERNVTMVASTMNLNGPFSNFIASRGIVPLYITVGARLPFFDNTLDMVHSMHLLGNWIPNVVWQFVLSDLYRILRPGGLFWLDHFFIVGGRMEEYVVAIDNAGFAKLKWKVRRKLEKKGAESKNMYISALLEKPLKNSW